MSAQPAQVRLYSILRDVLDRLRNEAPHSNSTYRPPAGNQDALIQARSRALLHLYLKARFGLVSFKEREAQVTDGAGDGGIDAFMIDEKTKTIFVLQSKFRATAGNFSTTNMSASDLLRMDVARILKGDKKDHNGVEYNERIRKSFQNAIRKLPDAGSYTTQVVLLGNAKHFSKHQLRKLIEGYSVDQYPHDRVYKDLLFPVISGTYFTDPNLTIEINLVNTKGDTHLSYDVRINPLKPNVKLLFVPTREIGRIMHTYKNTILKFNPRSFLELKGNRVNQEIEASITSVKSNEFALFNNGITIITDGTSISSDTARKDTAQVVLRNPQLVNGGQTAYTLGRIYEQCMQSNNFKIFTGKEVLLKIITFVGGRGAGGKDASLELIGEISKASNSQTKVDESDRRSNDPVQVKMQDELFEKFGLCYERKRGEFTDGVHSGYLAQEAIVNREKLVRVSLACDYRVSQARSSISKFFAEDVLDTQLKLKDAGRYAYGHHVLQILDRKRHTKPAKKGDRYHTVQFGQALRYGQYAAVAVCVNLGLAKHKSESEIANLVLSQWLKFEAWAEKRSANSAYAVSGSFDYVSYYKGSTINQDLQSYSFAV